MRDKSSGKKPEKTRAQIVLILTLVSLLLLLGCKATKPPKEEKEKPKIVGRRKPAAKMEGKVRVAYVSSRDGNEEIYLMDADGRNQKRLTKNEIPDTDPQVSPNGKRVAWRAKDVHGFWRLYDMALTGKRPGVFFTSAGDVLEFSWSPHSNWLALVKNFETRGDYHLWLLSSSGQSQTSLVPEVVESSQNDPAWFPDNKRLVYVSQEAGNVPKIFWRFVPTTTEPLLLSSGTKPSVSPDEKWVAFVNLQGDISVVPTQGGRARVLAETGLPSDGVSAPQWSPDSKLVLFGAIFVQPQKGNGVWVINVDGTGFKKLTGGFNPRWSPERKRIFFEDLDANTGVRQIWSAKADGTSRVQITRSDAGESYSPFPFMFSP